MRRSSDAPGRRPPRMMKVKSSTGDDRSTPLASQRDARGPDHRRPAHPDRPLRRRARAGAPRRPRRPRPARGRRAQRHRPRAHRRRHLRQRQLAPARRTATSRGWRRCSPACRCETPGVTVNRLCASGLEAVNQAARAIRPATPTCCSPGGVESMTRAPLVTLKPERGFPRGAVELVDTTIGWRFVNPRLAERYSTEGMGETAENVAERYGVSRADQDAFALRSHQRAVRAQEQGAFEREIVPVGGAAAARRAGDRRRRRGAAARHDARAARGAAARVPRGRHRHRRQRLADQRRCRLRRRRLRGRRSSSSERSRSPRVVATGAVGVDPAVMGIGPVAASRRALAALRLDDRRHRPRRAQRGVRVAVACLRARAGHPAREAQRQRRRDRARTPAGRIGRAPGRHARPRAAGARPAATGWRRCASASARAWRR